MRNIDEVILHCSDTRMDQNFDIEDIRRWHVSDNGWSDVGYHFVILLDGTIQKGRDLDIAGAHCKNHNSTTIGVCLMGGKKADGSKWDAPTKAQKDSFVILRLALDIVTGKELQVSPHSKYSTKSCPNFDIDKLI